MAIYKTYQEAVIANGSTDGIWFDTSTGGFCQEGLSTPPYWEPCNPADYLESLADFHARGLELTDGDKYTGLMGQVYTVGEQLSKRAIINRNQGNDQRYVVKAAAYNTETPEEKEAFEAMTDTTPQQFESLAKDEWDGGGLPPVGELFVVDDFDTVMLCKYSSKYAVIGEMVERQYPEGIEVVIDLMSTPNRKFSKPETQEQREERERMEAAYDLYCAVGCLYGGKPVEFDLWRNVERAVRKYLVIVDKAGYRKNANRNE